MAKVIPYLDVNAHGQLNKSICFRRRFGQVFLGNTVRPKNPRTQKQIDQREKFRNSSKGFPRLNFETRQFYNKLASQYPGTEARSLFMSHSLTDNLPSRAHGIPIKSIDELVIFKPAGTVPNNFIISVESLLDLTSIGCYFWNKLGNDNQVDHSEIGIGGIRTESVLYSPCKFDAGIDNVSDTNLITFPSAFLSPSKGIVEFYWIPHFPSTWGDAWANLFYGFGNEGWFYFLWSPATWHHGPKCFYLTVADLLPVLRLVQYVFNPPEFDEDSLHYIAIHFDLSKGAGEKIRLFFDDDFLSIHKIIKDSTADISAIDLRFFVSWGGQRSIMDNLKLYYDPNFWNLIKGNRENENFYPDPLPGITYASVQDSNRWFTPGEDSLFPYAQRIKITETAGTGAHIPFYYTIWVKWRDFQDNVSYGIMRLPEIDLPASGVQYLYIASDWSLYWDSKHTRLAAA